MLTLYNKLALVKNNPDPVFDFHRFIAPFINVTKYSILWEDTVIFGKVVSSFRKVRFVFIYFGV